MPADTDPETNNAKSLVGYCRPWSVRAGDTIELMASAREPGPATLDLVRLHCGDPTRSGPGFREELVQLRRSATNPGLPAEVELIDQAILIGSLATIDLDASLLERQLLLDLWFQPTLPMETATVATVSGPAFVLQLMIEEGRARVRIAGLDLALGERAVAAGRWYHVTVGLDLKRGQLRGKLDTPPTPSPGRDLVETAGPVVEGRFASGGSSLDTFILAGRLVKNRPQAHFNGRIARPRLTLDDTELAWDFGQELDGPTIIEISGAHLHGVLHQLPTRGVTGPTWDGQTQRWTDDPSQWDAIHFHTDDLYDAEWVTTAATQLPGSLPSGIYAFRLSRPWPGGETGPDGRPATEVDRVPFFVRPQRGAKTADVALLASTATYLAYANHRTLIDGADFMASRRRLSPEHDYVRTHPEVGLSMYERHRDGSGVMFSSRLRPVLNLRPGADRWNFTPDTDLNAFLEHVAIGHDIVTDEDLHAEGIDAIAPYRVLVTSTHPEYWSTAMLDGLDQWQRNGGRLLYLGGNGFYWRVSFSEHWPGAMELRRAEDGVRGWETGPGESYHAWGGEYGGLWRRQGRAPNQLVGVGFVAQGFERATHFDVNPESMSGRTAWMWDGVELVEGRLGTSGIGGGAAGQEIDRYDPGLGSPGHAVILASATDFGPDMVRTKEEFGSSIVHPEPDPEVRADIVFYETPAGGAVFSVGSIAWFGALARNGYDNDVARLTTNVVRRFANPEPFVGPG